MKKLLAALALACASLCAQPSCISIQDTIYSMGPSGSALMTGFIELKLGYFTSNGGFTITQSLTTLSITAKSNNLSACLTPSTVVQANYTVTTGGRTPVHYTTYWYVPNTGGPYQLTSVPSGVVNVAGTPGVVTWQSGLNFALVSVNDTPAINGSATVSVASVQSVTQITLLSGIGTLTSATFSDGPLERGRTAASGANPPSIYGPQGLPGATGAVGATGSTGAVGATGSVGATGGTGPQGPITNAPDTQIIYGTGASSSSSSDNVFQYTTKLLGLNGNINVTNVGTQGYSKFGPTTSSTLTAGEDHFVFTATSAAPAVHNYTTTVLNEFTGTATSTSRVTAGIFDAFTATGATGALTDTGPGGLIGITGEVAHRGTGTVAKASAVRGELQGPTNTTYTMYDVANFRATILSQGANQTMQSVASFRSSGMGAPLGTVTRSFGIRLDPQRELIFGTGSALLGDSTITMSGLTGVVTVGMRADGQGVVPDSIVTSVSGSVIGISNPTIAAVTGFVSFYTDVCAGLTGDYSLCGNNPAYLGSDFTATGNLTSTTLTGLNTSGAAAWNITTSGSGVAFTTDYASQITNGSARFALHPNGSSVLSAFTLANASGATNYGTLAMLLTGSTANLTVGRVGTAVTPVTALNLGEASGSDLTTICLRFGGVCAGTLTPAMYTAPAFTSSGVAFASIGAATAGASKWVSDATPGTTPCSGSGNGAWAFATSTGPGVYQWRCQ